MASPRALRDLLKQGAGKPRKPGSEGRECSNALPLDREIRMGKLRIKVSGACGPWPAPRTSAPSAPTCPPPRSTASASSTPSPKRPPERLDPRCGITIGQATYPVTSARQSDGAGPAPGVQASSRSISSIRLSSWLCAVRRRDHHACLALAGLRFLALAVAAHNRDVSCVRSARKTRSSCWYLVID